MSETPKDGGPAFPVSEPDFDAFKFRNTEELRRLQAGMTLRDYFAAKALQGSISRCLPTSAKAMDDLARDVYYVADAMLRARQS